MRNKDDEKAEAEMMNAQVTDAKHRLMTVADRLPSLGYMREAISLNRLCGLIEDWQNKARF